MMNVIELEKRTEREKEAYLEGFEEGKRMGICIGIRGGCIPPGADTAEHLKSYPYYDLKISTLYMDNIEALNRAWSEAIKALNDYKVSEPESEIVK